MAAQSQAGVRAPRLNPFAFPSDTDIRFVLLVVSIIGVSLYGYQLLYLNIPSIRKAEGVLLRQCLALSGAGHPAATPGAAFDAAGAFLQCMAAFRRETAAWTLVGAALMLGVAAAIYWLLPAWKLWRAHLVPFSPEDAPEIVTYLADLSREAGLARPPTFVCNSLNRARSGLAFGHLGQYYVVLPGGLVTQFDTDRPAFRAVVLHELAHLRNADVDKTYCAVALWPAFLVTAVVPFAATLFGSHDFAFIVSRGWRLAALTAWMYLARNAVLRAREGYADVRASLWDGPAGALRRVLEALPHPEGRRWRALWQVHPDPRARRLVLDEPHRLFQLDFLDAFGTGVAATMAYRSVAILLAPFMTVDLAARWAALLYGPLAVGVIGLGAWRTIFAACARRAAPRGLAPLGLGLGLGLMLGPALSFWTYGDLVGHGSSGSPVGSWGLTLGFTLVWAAVLFASLALFLWWLVAGASTWLEVAAADRALRLMYVVGLTLGGVMLAVWLGLLLRLRDLSQSLASTTDVHSVAVLAAVLNFLGEVQALQFLPHLAIIGLWAFPLAPWLWRGRVAPAAGFRWAFLDAPARPIAWPRQDPLHVGLALQRGLVGGLIFCGLLVVVRVGLRLGLSQATRSNADFVWAFYLGQVVAAALIQAGVAAITALRIRRLGVLHGLCAAFVTGWVTVGGILGINLLFGGKAMPTFVWLTIRFVFNAGVPPALLAACGAGIVTWWRRRLGVHAGRLAGAHPLRALLGQPCLEVQPLPVGPGGGGEGGHPPLPIAGRLDGHHRVDLPI
jgi:Zn-dependent protease with chaperone function